MRGRWDKVAVAVAARGPVPVPPGDFGTYRNGAIDYAITPDGDGGACLVVDGEVFPELALHDDRTFTVRDPATGRATPCGRFRGEPGAAAAVEIGGRLAAHLVRLGCGRRTGSGCCWSGWRSSSSPNWPAGRTCPSTGGRRTPGCGRSWPTRGCRCW